MKKNKKKIRVLHVLNTGRYSGAENVVCQIIDLFKEDYEYIFAYCSPDGPIRNILNTKKIKYIGLPKLSVSNLKAAVRRFKPNIIHAHDMRAAIISSLCCGNCKLIFTIHNNAPENSKFNFKTFLFHVACRRADHIIWVSDSALNDYYYREEVKSKSSVLYNIIDIDALYQKAEGDKNNYDYDIIFLGRLTPQKNPQRLLHVLNGVKRTIPDAKFTIVGSGEMEEDIKDDARRMGLDRNLDFMGFMENPYKILRSSKVMLMTSRWEGTPMSSLEAMAMGVPIVSTPTDGLKKVVAEGETGFLSEDNGTLIEKCCRLIENPDLRYNMSCKSMKRAKKLMNPQKYKEEIKKVYEKRK